MAKMFVKVKLYYKNTECTAKLTHACMHEIAIVYVDGLFLWWSGASM